MSNRGKILDYFRRRDRGWILSLFAVVCLIYLPFIGNPFVFDDLSFFAGNPADHYTQSLFRLELRWLPYASLGWTYALFSDMLPHFYRIGSMLLHAANVILLFYLLRQMMVAANVEHKNSVPPIWGAWLGALFFAANPVAVYAVGYVIERSILMATLFALLMQFCYLRGVLGGQKRWFILAVASYFMAVYSKEHSVMSLAVVAAMTVYSRDKIRASAQTLLLTWGGFIAVAILVVLSSKGVIGTQYEVMSAAIFEQQGVAASTSVLHLLSVLTQAGLFFKYLLLWLLPNPAWMSIDMREPFASSMTAWQNWLGVAGFVVYGALGFWLLLRPRWAGLLGLALLYPWLQFVVEFSTIRVQEPFVLYRSYLWMAGIALFSPLLLAKFPGYKTLFALGCIVLLLVPLSWNRLWVFGDNYRLWNDAAMLLPNERVGGADRILYNRGDAQLARHNWKEAIDDLEKVVALSPQLAPVHNTLGRAYFSSGRYQDAIAQFDAVIAIKPDEAQAYFGKAVSLKRLHADDQAMQQMKKACELKSVAACMVVSAVPSNKAR